MVSAWYMLTAETRIIFFGNNNLNCPLMHISSRTGSVTAAHIYPALTLGQALDPPRAIQPSQQPMKYLLLALHFTDEQTETSLVQSQKQAYGSYRGSIFNF